MSNSLTAGHVMQSEGFYFSENIPVIDLLSAITMGGFGSVPITKSGDVVVGIVSEYDILNAIQAGKYLNTALAREIMTKAPVAVPEEMPANEIIAILQSKHLIRVPVVDKNGVLIGIVARRDIFWTAHLS